jgi:hypothetical protein
MDFKLMEAKSGKKSDEREEYFTDLTKESVREIQKVA